MKPFAMLTCSDNGRNGAKTLAVKDTIDVELVSVERSQVGDGDLTRASLHGQCLEFAF